MFLMFLKNRLVAGAGCEPTAFVDTEERARGRLCF
jgi:hypothetical protein